MISDFRKQLTVRRIFVVAGLAYAIPLYVFLTLLDRRAATTLNDVVFFAYTAITMFVFGFATWRTRRVQPGLYKSWFGFTVALGLLLACVITWGAAEIILGRSGHVSTGSTFMILANVALLWGISQIPRRPQTRLQNIRQTLDTMTTYIGTLLLVWMLWIKPLLSRAHFDVNGFVVILIYLFLHLTLIVAVLSALARAQSIQPRRPLFLLAVALVCLFLADIAMALQNPFRGFQPDEVAICLYLGAVVLACSAAVAQAIEVNGGQSQQQHRSRFQSRYCAAVRIALPPVILFFTYISMIFSHRGEHHDWADLIAIGIAVMFILVSVRQILTLMENGNLTFALRKELTEHQLARKELQLANETLEQHVTERTKELVILNEQLRENEGKLRFDAFHDKLTGLPNRAAFIHHLESALQVSQRDPSYRFAVLFLDFDGFKIVNDSLGHWLGDELLIALAHRLREDIPVGNLVARLGGDEFLVLLEHFVDECEPLEIAEHIQQTLRRPFEIRDYRLYTSASIGVVLKDEFHTTAGDVLRDADIAMYKAKENGKARCVVFDTAMRAKAVARLKLENALRNALARNELSLAYQPICNIPDQKITGFEALARWHHPEHGFVSPSEFIPIAEETGLIIPLGEWVLEEACRQLKQWQDQSVVAADLTMSVNISAHQLYQGDLTEVVTRILREVGLAPTALKLEITESIFMEDVETAIATFSHLRALGVQLQVDDFGTGYSSFNYLYRLPIDTLKIDKSFIDLLNLGGQHVEIVRAIAALAHNLQLTVIAEGVETEEQLRYVEQLACEQVQGYLISKPLPQDAATAFIQSFAAAHATPNSLPCADGTTTKPTNQHKTSSSPVIWPTFTPAVNS